ncbi:MAG: flavin reductase family protein [Actinomycetia bacterium]|nr:flavin reductase family protein [Actinomycetes bacterium]
MFETGEFRRALGRFTTGVAVISAHAGAHHHAMTANSFTSVSLEPPLVLFCVERDARFHDAVIESGVFGVSVLAADQRAIAVWLATPGRPLIGQLDRIAHEESPRGCALIEGAVATLEATVTAVHAAGDHSIVVGAVTFLDVPDEPAPGLLYSRSRYVEEPGAY